MAVTQNLSGAEDLLTPSWSHILSEHWGHCCCHLLDRIMLCKIILHDTGQILMSNVSSIVWKQQSKLNEAAQPHSIRLHPSLLDSRHDPISTMAFGGLWSALKWERGVRMTNIFICLSACQTLRPQQAPTQLLKQPRSLQRTAGWHGNKKREMSSSGYRGRKRRGERSENVQRITYFWLQQQRPKMGLFYHLVLIMDMTVMPQISFTAN